MIKKLIGLLSILTIITINTNAKSNNKRASNSRRVSTVRNSTTPSNINVSGSLTQVSATISDTTTTQSDLTKIAPPTDKIAERNCTQMVVTALKNHCGKNKCKNPTEIYATMNYTSTTNANEIYCANFLETSVNKLWNSYDSYAQKESQNCDLALARAFAAEACYNYVMTNIAGKVRISQGSLNPYCGTDAVFAQYNRIAADTVPSAGSVPGLTGDDLTLYFSKVGNIGVSDLMAYPGRVLDLKIDFKTSAFPREIVQIVNTLKSQGNVMCGANRYTELYDTNFPVEIKQSAWQKAVAEKGFLKGSSDFISDQVGVITGTDSIDEYKKGGLMNVTNKSKDQQAADTLDNAKKDLTQKLHKKWDSLGSDKQTAAAAKTKIEESINSLTTENLKVEKKSIEGEIKQLGGGKSTLTQPPVVETVPVEPTVGGE